MGILSKDQIAGMLFSGGQNTVADEWLSLPMDIKEEILPNQSVDEIIESSFILRLQSVKRYKLKDKDAAKSSAVRSMKGVLYGDIISRLGCARYEMEFGDKQSVMNMIDELLEDLRG